LAALNEDDFITIHAGADHYGDNMAIIAPGTGLGEGGLYWDGKTYHPFPTEGGHADFSPRTELDIELYQYLQKKYNIVSWEKVIAGPGIHDIYRFLCEVKKRKEEDWVKDLLEKEDPSAVISQFAIEEKDPACMETMQLYVRYLARESCNLVLKLKATGGLFLGGGIPPKITSILQQNVFYDNFLDCDRMQHLVKKTPVKIILNNKTALLGAAYYGAYS
jgi:glucokinase